MQQNTQYTPTVVANKLLRLSSQFDNRSIGSTMKSLKTKEQRNAFLKHISNQKQLKKDLEELQVMHEKQHILQSSKKKFLSLIRSKDSSSQFLKFKPTHKPLNILKMIHELKLSDRIPHSKDSDMHVQSKGLSQGTPQDPKSSHSRHIKMGSGTLAYLTYSHKKDIILPQPFKNKSSSDHSHKPKKDFSHIIKLKNLSACSIDEISATPKASYVPSQVLARNGILLPQKHCSWHTRAISQNDECLEDDNSSLASHTELKLESLYQSAQNLRQSHKHFSQKKQEQQQEAIKLFYKKIYQKL